MTKLRFAPAIGMNPFLSHTAMTTPGSQAARVSDLPDDLPALVEAVRGWFVHDAGLRLYGLDRIDRSTVSRQTLPFETRLRRLSEASPQPLSVDRPVADRQIGTCRDYALALCGLLREKGHAARIRCGFATYFRPGRFEDHWICESRTKSDDRWVRIDAQLDRPHAEHLNIDFDTLDLPRDRFLTAREAWLLVRERKEPPELFGHGDAIGGWFLRVNLARDLLALAGEETSPWDGWRSATDRPACLDNEDIAACDALAEGVATLEAGRAPGPDHPCPRPFW